MLKQQGLDTGKTLVILPPYLHVLPLYLEVFRNYFDDPVGFGHTRQVVVEISDGNFLRQAGGEKAGAPVSAVRESSPLSSSLSITTGIEVIPGGKFSARTSIGMLKPSMRFTFRDTSGVPPRGRFGCSVLRSTRNEGLGLRKTR